MTLAHLFGGNGHSVWLHTWQHCPEVGLWLLVCLQFLCKGFEKLGCDPAIPLGLGLFLSSYSWKHPAAKGNSTCFIQLSSTDISQEPPCAPWNKNKVVRWCTTDKSALWLPENTHLSIFIGVISIPASEIRTLQRHRTLLSQITANHITL